MMTDDEPLEAVHDADDSHGPGVDPLDEVAAGRMTAEQLEQRAAAWARRRTEVLDLADPAEQLAANRRQLDELLASPPDTGGEAA